jgi:hypothetical protein
MLSDPDYWNQILDSYLGMVIKEQKMMNELRQALEKPFAANNASTEVRQTFIICSSYSILVSSSRTLLLFY